MRRLLTLGILAMLGCAAPKPIPATMLNEYDRPREDLSRRTLPQDDAPGSAPEATPPVSFPEDESG